MGFRCHAAGLLLAACFLAFFPSAAWAAQVTVIITGSVYSGTDTSGVFGPSNSDLTGQPFTLTMRFDDTAGTSTSQTCPDGTVYDSGISGTNASNPGTAVLQIGGGSFPIGGGSMNQNFISSYALRFGAIVCAGNPYSAGVAGYQIGAGYGGDGITTYRGSSGFGFGSGPSTFPASGTILTASGDWRTLIPAAALDTAAGHTLPFNILVIGPKNFIASGYLGQQSLTVIGPPPTEPPDKQLGRHCSCDCTCVGEPITVSSGNAFQQITDYATTGQNQLSFTRYYNSLGKLDFTVAGTVRANWRTTYSRTIQTISPTKVAAYRADGQVLPFSLSGSAWTPDSDVDVKLVQSGGTWTLTDKDDTVETYTTATQIVIPGPEVISINYGRLASIQSRNDYAQTLSYDGNNELLSVTDTYGRTLNFTYGGNGRLQTVTTPDGLVMTYGYSASPQNQLTSVTYSTTPAATQTYLYENAAVPFALTGIIDENGNRFATWSYDGQGRGLSSQHAGGADLTTVSYDDTTGNRTVTYALGQQEIYKFSTLQNVPKVVEIDRLATATTAAATRKFSYDTNGYIASSTDWNGNLNTFANDVHGQPTSIVEASGTPYARTTTVAYHATYHLPLSIVTPGLTTAFTYDAAGELLTRTLTDTTVTIAPYSTNGTARTWTYSWSNFLLASAKGPRTDVAQLTSFAYDGTGALTKVTNALGQATQITAHLPGGLPQAIVDPNGVTTTLTYDARLRLLTSALSTGAGLLTTSFAYDAAGELLTITRPDGSALTNSYDAAHRLTGVADKFSQTTFYTLDGLGDRTLTQVANSGGTVQRQHSGNYDALGRILQDIGGAGQSTKFAYDANGNPLTVTDPLGHATQQAFDPLNRLTRVIDAAGGITKAAYDPHDRPVTVVDANSGTTTYVYDGFGDVIQRISPDTGKTVYRYNLAGNLTQSVDAAGATANYSYDVLDRVLTTTYPADAAENVSYSYDQGGHGFGIGRLTSLTDAAGMLSRNYDERGNVLSENRVHGAVTLATGFTYDAAARVSSITYPSGWNIAYSRDVMGRITVATAKSPVGAAQTILSGVGYQAFGPVNALTYGNGVAEARSFDLDYRMLHLTDTGASALQNLTYGYDAADNVLSIADGVTAANSQNLGYDVLNRLTSASGNYGALAYTYNAVGNRLTQTSGGVLTSYSYASAQQSTHGHCERRYDADGRQHGRRQRKPLLSGLRFGNELDLQPGEPAGDGQLGGGTA